MKIVPSSPTGRPLRAAVLVASASGLLLAGCVASPTYGTGRTANAQLVDDIAGIIPFSGSGDRETIAYTPRPELVRPASMEVLPTPQPSVASAENPAWPESPEERRARVRQEATDNQETPGYRPRVRGNIDTSDRWADREGPEPLSASHRSEVLQRRAAAAPSTTADRRYLSEPPVVYRQPSDTAPADELGESERIKAQRAQRAAASGRNSGGGWRRLVPWL